MKIVDEFTGRILEGRRWSEGLHQAVEAKEGVKIKEENQTLATITLQNYFRMYDKLAGMTGTAGHRGGRVRQHLRPPGRARSPRTGRWSASTRPTSSTRPRTPSSTPCVEDIAERYETRPAGARRHDLGGEVREARPRMLEKRGIPHEVLNAKQHTREAEIVAQAGRLARDHRRHQHGRPRRRHPPRRQPRGPAPTRDVAGRGPRPRDRRGHGAASPSSTRAATRPRRDAEGDKVRELGGLYVLGTERHESRRIDNQLRGRSGRQGDPGESRFYLSLEDELMRLFATGAMNWVMGKALPDDVPIEAKMVTKAIERAQNTVEQRNAEIRKNVLKYDEVMNEQRKVIYKRRDQILDGADLRDEALEYLADAVDGDDRARYCVADFDEEWDLDGLIAELASVLARPRSPPSSSSECRHHRRALRALDGRGHRLLRAARGASSAPRLMREVERQVMLQHHRPALARAPLRDGLPPGGHQPAGHGPEGSARRVAARGLRDVRRDDARHRPGLRASTSCTCRSSVEDATPAPAAHRHAATRRPRTRRRAAAMARPRPRPAAAEGGEVAADVAGRGRGHQHAAGQVRVGQDPAQRSRARAGAARSSSSATARPDTLFRRNARLRA